MGGCDRSHRTPEASRSGRLGPGRASNVRSALTMATRGTRSKTPPLGPGTGPDEIRNDRTGVTVPPVGGPCQEGKSSILGPRARPAQDVGPEASPAPCSPPKILEVTGFAQGGRGLAKSEGVVWFVEGAVVGDTVLAEPLRSRPRYVEARAVSLVAASPVRREPPCPYQSRCGGCPWMPLPEPIQRSSKRSLLLEAFERIGGLRGIPVDEVVSSPRELGYRNKVEFVIGTGPDGRRVVGLHGGGPGAGLVDIERCLLQADEANRLLQTARGFFLEGPGRHDPGLGQPGEPVRLSIRSSESTGELLVGFWTGAVRPCSLEEFASVAMREHPALRGVVQLVRRGPGRGGARVVAVRGEPFLEERLGGVSFRLPAGSFFQVNTAAAARLVETAVEQAGSVEGFRVLDLYGGVGVFGLALAAKGARAEIVEADGHAVRSGREAAALVVGGGRAHFVRADVETFLSSLETARRRPDLVVADPPRRGLRPEAVRAISRLGPKRILLVSCEPVTLARDLKLLCAAGYKVERAIPFDLFPQTPHLETLVRLERA